MSKSLIFAITVALTLFVEHRTHASDAPLEILRQTFAQFGCSGDGGRPEEISAQLRAMILAFEKDPDCQGTIPSNLFTLQNQIESIDQYQDAQKRIAILEAQTTEIISQLMVETDQNRIASLKSLISANQTALAGYRAELEQNQFVRKRPYQKAILQLSETIRNVIDSSAANKKCFIKRSNEFSSIMSIIGSAAGTVAVANPVLAVGIAAGTKLVDYAASEMKFRRFNKEYQNLMRNEFNNTLSCAIRAMSEDYCRANDQVRLIKRKLTDPSMNPAKTKVPIIESMAKLIELNKTEIPRIRNWLEQIAAQSGSLDSYEAERKASVKRRASQVEISEDVLTAKISESRRIYDRLLTDVERWPNLKNIVNSLSARIEDQFSPLYEVKQNDDSTKYELIGIRVPPKNANGDRISWQQFSPFEYSVAVDYSLSNLEKRIKAWIESAKVQIERELSEKTQIDPHGVVISGQKDSKASVSEGRKVTAQEALLAIQSAFKDEIKRPSLPQSYVTFYNDSVSRIEKVLNVLDHAAKFVPGPIVTPLPEPSPVIGPIGLPFPNKTAPAPTTPTGSKTLEEKALEWVNEIYNSANLSKGTSFLTERMEFLVRSITLNIQLEANDEEREIAAMFYASRQVADQISKKDRWNVSDAYGQLDDEELLANASSNLLNTRNNARSFISMFRKDIRRALKRLEKDIKEDAGTDLLVAHREKQSTLCFGLWINGEWPKGIPIEKCLDAKPVTQMSIPVPEFRLLAEAAGLVEKSGQYKDEEIQKFQKSENRTCALQNFKRAKRIISFGGKPF